MKPNFTILNIGFCLHVMSISSQLTAQSFSAAMTFLNQNICFGIYLFIYLFIYSLTYLSIYLFVCLFIYLSVHLSVLFICLLYLFIYLLIYINHLVTVQGLNKALVHALAIALKNERSPQPEQVQHLPGYKDILAPTETSLSLLEGFAQSTMFRDEDWVYFIEHGLSHVMRYLIKRMKLEMISYRCPPETACPGDDLQCYVSTCKNLFSWHSLNAT